MAERGAEGGALCEVEVEAQGVAELVALMLALASAAVPLPREVPDTPLPVGPPLADAQPVACIVACVLPVLLREGSAEPLALGSTLLDPLPPGDLVPLQLTTPSVKLPMDERVPSRETLPQPLVLTLISALRLAEGLPPLLPLAAPPLREKGALRESETQAEAR